jgi:hypothetical protein
MIPPVTGCGVGRKAVAVLLALAGITACTQTVTQTRASRSDDPALSTCTVSEDLVASCGAWFGVSSPSADGAFDYTRGLDEYETLVATPPDILHFYERGGEPFPDAEQITLAERPGRPRSLLYFAWKPDLQLTWRQIASGAADASIESVAAGLGTYPHRMFLTIQHEPENDIIADPGSGMTAADYVAMYRYVVGRLRALGVDNVVYVMGFMGFERWATLVDDIYPGDDVVDWIAYDPYGFREHETFDMILNDPAGNGWPGFYDWATEKSPGTPIMLGEWGFDLQSNDRAADIVAAAPTILRSEFPMIKALVYWNDIGRTVDARLSGGAANAAAFARSFAELASDPYFNMTSTDDAP